MIVGIYIENYRAGGLDRVVIDLVNYWPNQMDQFVLFCNESHAGLDILKKEIRRPIRFVTYPTPISMRQYGRESRLITQLRQAFYNTVGCYLLMPAEIRRMRRMFEENKVDVVMIHNGGWPAARSTRSTAFAGRKAGATTLIVVHGLMTPHHPLIALQEKILEKRLGRAGVKIVAISKTTKEYLARYTALPPSEVIYSGTRDIIKEAQAPGKDLRAELNLSPDEFLIGTFGTYEPFRGHGALLEAMKSLLKQVSNAVLLIVGTGTDAEKQTLERMIDEGGLKGRVRLLGFRTDVPRIMAGLNVIVQPIQSLASFGLLIVEGMAAKKPVVASGIGGILEIIEEGKTGFLVPPAEPERFAEAFAKLARDPELQRRMGEAGHARYLKDFHASRMGRDYHSFVTENGKTS